MWLSLQRPSDLHQISTNLHMCVALLLQSEYVQIVAFCVQKHAFLHKVMNG